MMDILVMVVLVALSFVGGMFLMAMLIAGSDR